MEPETAIQIIKNVVSNLAATPAVHEEIKLAILTLEQLVPSATSQLPGPTPEQ